MPKGKINECLSCPFREAGTTPKPKDCKSCEQFWAKKLDRDSEPLAQAQSGVRHAGLFTIFDVENAGVDEIIYR